jgi:hypothetical protein
MKMKRTRRLVALSALLAIVFATSSAQAFHERHLHNIPHAQAHPSGGKLDNGKTSLTKLVPPITKVFDYSGDIWKRGTMFGDLGGVRNDLYDHHEKAKKEAHDEAYEKGYTDGKKSQ